MSTRAWIKTYALALSLMSGHVTAVAHAETLTFHCQEQQFNEADQSGGPAELTLVYEGAESGILKVNASFGKVELPATLTEQDSDAAGTPVHVIGIRASGPVTALMPIKAEIEDCVAVKAAGETLDADMAAYHVNSCRLKASRPAKPVAIAASLELTLLGPSGGVLISRTYDEPSDVVGGAITLETWPMPQCTLARRD